jgi:hypothetical protein
MICVFVMFCLLFRVLSEWNSGNSKRVGRARGVALLRVESKNTENDSLTYREMAIY